MFKNAILVFMLLLPLACRSSMGARKDASPVPEAGSLEVAPDLPMAPDLSRLDGPLADTSIDVGVPKAFKVENHTDHTIYLQSDYPVQCQVAGTSGWQACTYFTGCSFLCPQVSGSQNCCIACEQNLELYVIPAGQSRSIPWDGLIFRKQKGTCTECECDQPMAVTGGSYEAAVRVYAAYQCYPGVCQTSPDGVLADASPVGPHITTRVPFSVPSAGEEVIIAVTENQGQDAGPPDTPIRLDGQPALDSPLDSPRADSARDLGSESAALLSSDVAGRSFQIAADEALPDASMYGRSCGTSNPGAHYRLIFSGDAAKVTIMRADPVQETMLNGTLVRSSSALLEYDLAPTFAGGSLVVRRDGDDLIGMLAIHGSGVPVIWCIESPMRPM